MQKIIFILILSFSSINGFAQKFPNGVYVNIDQLRNRTPEYNKNLRVVERTEDDIDLNGGNDYEIKSGVDSINKKFIKETVYAYVKNDSLYLNTIHHSGKGYVFCLTQGAFLVFKGKMTDENSEKEEASQWLGGKGAEVNNAAKKRTLYVLSLRTGNIRRLNKQYIRERLKENEDLLYKLEGEPNPDSESTLVKYMGLLNNVLAIDSAAPVPQEK